MWLKKMVAWSKGFFKRISGFSTPIFGLSWREDKSPKSEQEKEMKQDVKPENSTENQGKYYHCAFCNRTGKDRFRPEPCRVCKGTGGVIRNYYSPVTCSYCNGTGSDPYKPSTCRVCGGVGLTERAFKNNK